MSKFVPFIDQLNRAFDNENISKDLNIENYYDIGEPRLYKIDELYKPFFKSLMTFKHQDKIVPFFGLIRNNESYDSNIKKSSINDPYQRLRNLMLNEFKLCELSVGKIDNNDEYTTRQSVLFNLNNPFMSKLLDLNPIGINYSTQTSNVSTSTTIKKREKFGDSIEFEYLNKTNETKTALEYLGITFSNYKKNLIQMSVFGTTMNKENLDNNNEKNINDYDEKVSDGMMNKLFNYKRMLKNTDIMYGLNVVLDNNFANSPNVWTFIKTNTALNGNGYNGKFGINLSLSPLFNNHNPDSVEINNVIEFDKLKWENFWFEFINTMIYESKNKSYYACIGTNYHHKLNDDVTLKLSVKTIASNEMLLNKNTSFGFNFVFKN